MIQIDSIEMIYYKQQILMNIYMDKYVKQSNTKGWELDLKCVFVHRNDRKLGWNQALNKFSELIGKV